MFIDINRKILISSHFLIFEEDMINLSAAENRQEVYKSPYQRQILPGNDTLPSRSNEPR